MYIALCAWAEHMPPSFSVKLLRGLIQFDPVVELGGVMVEKEQECEEAVMARVADKYMYMYM